MNVHRPRRTLIAAVDEAYGMGNRGSENPMPVWVPNDLKHFKRETVGNTVLLGRKTYDTLPEQPLPGRKTILVSRQRKELLREHYGVHDDLSFANSLEEAVKAHMLECPETDLFIAGGRSIYEQALEERYVDSAVLSRFPEEYGCDVQFPKELFESYGWRIDSVDAFPVGAGSTAGFADFFLEKYSLR